jgi:hypothetical protein
MQLKAAARVAVIGIMVLASDLVIGQDQRTSKFAKYLAPTPVRYMDFVLLQTEVAIIKVHVGLGPEALLPIPSLSYDAKNDRIQAFVSLTGDFAKWPLDDIRNRLHLERALCNGALAESMPGLQRKDFILIVYVAGKPFAECDQDDCVIR